MTKLRLIFATRSCAPIRLEPDVALVMRMAGDWIIRQKIEAKLLLSTRAKYSYRSSRSLGPE